MNLLFMTKLPSMKQEWNRGFGAFLRNPDFRRFSGTVSTRTNPSLAMLLKYMRAYYIVNNMTVELTERQRHKLLAILPTDIASLGDNYKFTSSFEFISDFAFHHARMGQVLTEDASDEEIASWRGIIMTWLREMAAAEEVGG